MDRKFIIDKEIDLNDYDFLKTKIYADNLTKIIKNTEEDKVFTVGLFGNWGSGKSSIIETSKQDFDKKKVRFITYDAWQYIDDSFRRMFLRKLRKDLGYEETDLMRRFYENESMDVGNKYKLSPTRTALILVGVILILPILFFVPIPIEYKFPLYVVFTLLGLLITIISGAFHQLKISVTKPHLFAPEQFEGCFREIVSNSLQKTSLASRILKWVKGDNSIKNLEKLVVVIDNIDRCSNDIAYQLLTDIKTFLSSEPYSIVFVIPVDDEALRKHIIKSGKESDGSYKEKEEFLRKFFNVTVRIKPYGETDMFSFAKQISDKNNLDFKPETINLASKEYAKNPRRIIQLFNNLLAEINYYETEFVQENETLICCVLIIREEYPNYYKSVINCPKLFINRSLPENYDGVDREEINRFIRIAHHALGRVSIADLGIVLTNSHNQFDDIYSELKDSILSFNTEEVLEYWSEGEERIVDFIVHELDSAIKNQLIRTELVSYFELLAEINVEYPLESHICKKIEERIIPYIGTVIEEVLGYDILCIYALQSEKYGNTTFKEALVKACKLNEQNLTDGFEREADYWRPLFETVLHHFKDARTAQELNSTCTLKHDVVTESMVNDFSQEQFLYLISDELVQKKIDDLPTNATKDIVLETNTEAYRILCRLFDSKRNLALGTYGKFFGRLADEYNSERLRGKAAEDIAKLLQFIQPCLDLIPDRKLSSLIDPNSGNVTTDVSVGVSIPNALYGQIVNSRKMPNSNSYYQNDPRYDQEKNFIDECIESNAHVQKVIDFVTSTYRIADNSTDVSAEVSKLLVNHRDQLNIDFLELIGDGYDLQPFLISIFEDGNYSNQNTVMLLKHCFYQKNNESGEYLITENNAKAKISELITFAQVESSDEVFALLKSLAEQNRYSAILSDIIVKKDSEFINSLPDEFQKLAVDSFTEQNYEDFKNNFAFLSVIATHEDVERKKIMLDKIIIPRIADNDNVDTILPIIDSVTDIKNVDPYGVLTALLSRYQQENKDVVSDEFKEKIEQTLRKIKASKVSGQH